MGSGDDVVPEAQSDGAVAQEAGAPETNGRGKPPTRREVQARAVESREDALARAFGNSPDDDEDLLAAAPDAGSSDDELLDEPSPQPDKSPERPTGVTAEEVAALRRELTSLREELNQERARQKEPDDLPEEIDYDVDVEPGFEALKPSFKAVGERAERQNRELNKQVKTLVEEQFQIKAQLDLQRFTAEPKHADFWTYADEIAATAKTEGIDLYDYKSLKVAYDLVKGRKAIARVEAAEKRRATETAMSAKAGPVRKVPAPQQQVRDEEAAPGSRNLTFDEAWEKGLAKLRKSQRRG